MKKLLVLILGLSMILSLTACGRSGESTQSTEDTPEDVVVEEPEEEVTGISPLVGGWTAADSPVITDEIKSMMERVSGDYEGITYIPVAYISSQVVSGTNHTILCKTVLDGEQSGTYSIAVVYEDLEGNAEMMNMMECGAEAALNPQDGGWQDPESPEVTAEAADVFEKAMEKDSGTTYIPLALVSTQVVAGTNYCILARSGDNTTGDEEGLALVYLYADLEGNAEVTEVVPFELNKG